jgi:hypothetical protein
MRKIMLGLTGATLMTVSACATVPARQPGSELVGRTMRVELPNGQATLLRFAADGTVTGTAGPNQAVGRWSVANRQICMDWPRQGRECFPYAQPFAIGKTVSVTGSSGATVRVTLQ